MKLELLAGLVLALPLVPAFAGEDAVGGPVLGYAVEASPQALRPILGVPGASLLGDRVALGFDAATSALSARRSYLLAVDSSDGSLALVLLGRDLPTRMPVEGAPAGASRIVLSPGETTAGVFYPDTNSVLVLKGLPGNPQIAGSVSLAGLPAAAGALAVSDDAGVVLAAASGGLYASPTGGQPQPVTFSGEPSLLAFLPGTRDALVAGSDNQVALVTDVAGEPGYRLLAGPDSGISQPAGVAALPGNRAAVVANAGSATVVIVDLAGGVAATLPCSCQVTGLDRFNGEAVFRISDVAGAPAWLLEAGGTEPRLLFVPAAVAAVEMAR